MARFSKTISVQCYEQYCVNGPEGWLCKFPNNEVQNCKLNETNKKDDVCIEMSYRNGKDIRRSCWGTEILENSKLAELKEGGKCCVNYPNNEIDCYCKSSFCNNQFKFPEKFKVDTENYQKTSDYLDYND